MRFEDEIIRAVKHQAATDTEPTAPKTGEETETIADRVRSTLSSSSYYFSNQLYSFEIKSCGHQNRTFFCFEFAVRYYRKIITKLNRCLTTLYDILFLKAIPDAKMKTGIKLEKKTKKE